MQIHIKYSLIFLFFLLSFSCKNEPEKQQQQDINKATDDELVEINRILIKKDQLRIKNYIARMRWNMTETETGLWYEILYEGSGEKATEGKVATLNYTLSLMDGNICYSSNELGPKQFLIGKGNVETGLEQGILLLKQGDKARLILPPYLGYGLPGDGNKIPARAVLVYEIELLSISNP